VRILQVNNYAHIRGGSERYFHNLSSELSKEHDVMMFSTLSQKFPIAENRHLFWEDLPRELLLDGKQLGDAMNYFWRADVEKHFLECVESFRPDVIHLHIYHGQLTYSIIKVAKLKNIKIIQTVHDFKMICAVDSASRNNQFCTKCHGGSFYHCVVHKCNRDSLLRSAHTAAECYFRSSLGSENDISKYIFVSDFQAIKHLEIFPNLKYDVIPNFTPSSQGVEPSMMNENYLFYPTRLESGKGVERLLDLYKLAISKGIKLPKCFVAGEGSLLGHYRNVLNSFGLSDHIFFVGSLSGDSLSKHYAYCSAVINFSSLNETFGLTVIEGFAYGKPCITSTNGALVQFTTDERLGLAINFDLGITSALDDFISFFERKKDNRSAILSHYQKEFSPQPHVDSIVRCYGSVL